MSYADAAAAYRRNAILTASPEKVIKLLYDGAIQNLERSRIGLSDAQTSHSAEVGVALGKAISIIGELRSALDHEVGGEIAENLDTLYEFSTDQISEANISRTPAPIDNTLRVLRTLKEGWDGIIPN
ncbi:MAG: flagellar export chaperone FliS [Planctomycetota bacterium]|jgi:flagellar protein FliS